MTLRVHPTGSIALVLRDAGTQLPVDDAWIGDVREIDGDGTASHWGSREGRYVIQVTHPGRYRVAFHDVPGYAPVPPREVPVEAGRSSLVEVELAPR